MTSTAIAQPTVYLVIGSSAIARDEKGEILETVDWTDDNQPDWTDACICDFRGAGGEEGFKMLHDALEAAEANAKLIGDDIVRLP